jgi:flagellar FliL protein
MPLILGVLAALLGGGGGFYATWSGMIFGPESETVEVAEDNPVGALPDVTFVAVDPMTISLGSSSSNKHLRFRAHLEVPTQHQADVEHLLPRVVDVLNGYLRAVETKDLESPSALSRLRAQMLRRVQIVTGTGRVNDLLVMEFVLN